MRPRQNRCNCADSIFKCISLNKNALILLTISLTFVSKVQINNIPGLVQIMACCRPGNKPLSEPMVASFLTHICMTWLQWVNYPCITSDMSLKHNSSVSIRQLSDIKCETSHLKLKQKCWGNFRCRLHWKWQLPVQPMTKNFVNVTTFLFQRMQL